MIDTDALSFEEASRLIGGLRRDRSPLPPQATIDRLHQALDEGDPVDIGQVLLAAKRQTKHGHIGGSYLQSSASANDGLSGSSLPYPRNQPARNSMPAQPQGGRDG